MPWQGYEVCKRDLLAFLEEYKEPVDATDRWVGC